MGRKPMGEQPLPLQPRTVKGTDSGLWWDFKLESIRQHRTVGDCLNEAMADWLKKRRDGKE